MGQFISGVNGKQCNEDGLILYYHPFSYYSQKVLFVLEEKNIPYNLHEVDVTNGEQCSNWFIQMNPKIDVPVLRNGTLIVPSSNQIINYLELNFSDEKHTRLLSMNDMELRKKIIYFHRRISQIPIGIISLGSILHPDIVSWPKLPFVGPLRNGILQSENEMLNKLETYAEQNQMHRDDLLSKVEMQRKKYEMIKQSEEFQKLSTSIENLLEEIEMELKDQFAKSNRWLCCDQFTIADISLGVFLHRLTILGLRNYFWSDNKKPLLANYYRRITARKSFQNSLPSMRSTVKIVWCKLPYSYKICAIGLSSLIVGIVIYKI